MCYHYLAQHYLHNKYKWGHTQLDRMEPKWLIHHSVNLPEYLQLRDICSLLYFSIVSTRTEMDEENERFAARAGSMKESRSVAAKHPRFKEAFFKDSVPPKITLVKFFQDYSSRERISRFSLLLQMKKWCWYSVKHEITPSVTKATLPNHPAIQNFIDHCCRNGIIFIWSKDVWQIWLWCL